MANQGASGSEEQSTGQYKGQSGFLGQVRSTTQAAAGASESTRGQSPSHVEGVSQQRMLENYANAYNAANEQMQAQLAGQTSLFQTQAAPRSLLQQPSTSLPQFVGPRQLQRQQQGNRQMARFGPEVGRVLMQRATGSAVNQTPSATLAQQPVSSFQPQQAASSSRADPTRPSTHPPTAPQPRQPVRLFPQPPPVAEAAQNHALMQKWINVSNPEVQRACTATSSSPAPHSNVRFTDPSTPQKQQEQQAGSAPFQAAAATTGRRGSRRVRPVEKATQEKLDQLSGCEAEDSAEVQQEGQPEPAVSRPHSGFVEPASNPPPRRQSMRWTTENDKLLLLFGLGKVPGSWNQAIANFFPEKPTAKAVQERLTKLRAQQRKALTEAGIKDCFETTHGEEMEALSQPPPAKRQRLGSAPGESSVASNVAAPSPGAQQTSSPPPVVPAAALPEESVVVVVEEDVEGEGEEDFEERQRMLEAKKYQEDLERGFFRRGM